MRTATNNSSFDSVSGPREAIKADKQHISIIHSRGQHSYSHRNDEMRRFMAIIPFDYADFLCMTYSLILLVRTCLILPVQWRRSDIFF